MQFHDKSNVPCAQKAPGDYGPVRPRTKHADRTTKTAGSFSLESTKAIFSSTTALLVIKPPKGERTLSKEQEKKWPFFDDWDIDRNELREEVAYFKNRNDADDCYDPVDHVSILLGGCSEEFKNYQREADNSAQKSTCSESVWLKRRRVAMVERRVPCDSILMKGKIVDDDGFLVEGSETKVSSEKGSEGSTRDKWISFGENTN
jgi:hypothetical protein